MHSFLVISNDNSVHKFLKGSLDKDCIIHTAKTFEEALQVFLKKDIDVAFLDVILRDEGADKLIDNLRQIDIDPAIIAIVPEAQPMLSEEAMRVKPYELLEKPLKKEVIRQALERALERQELKRILNFTQLQVKNLKPVNEDNELSDELISYKQIRTSDNRLTYKEVFQKFSKALTHVYDLERLVDLTVEALAEIFRVGRVVFILVNREEGVSRPYRSLGLNEKDFRDICFLNDYGIMSWLNKNHQILSKDVIDREIASGRLTGRDIIRIQREMGLLQAQLYVPIFAKGSIMSVIALGNKITGKAYFDEDIELLSMLAGYIGVAVENAFLYQEINLRKVHNENVLENIPCGVIAINNDGKVNTFNRSASKMLHVPSHEVLGKDVKHIGSVFADIILRTLKDKKTYRMSEISDPATHSTYAISTSLLVDADRELGAIMVLSDLNEIKKLELKVKDLEKKTFFSMLSNNMAHYVKNHLVAVKTFVDLFPEKLKDREFVEQFSHVARREVSNLDLMTKKLTTLGENKGLIRRKVDIKLLLDQALDSHKDKMAESNITLLKKYSEEIAAIHGDCEKLEEVFANLVLNAVEAMPKGGTLTVEVSSVLLDEKKLVGSHSFLNNGGSHSRYNGTGVLKKLPLKYVEVVIQDTGAGIPQDELKSIFLPFFTTKPHNIGLGLSISKRIVEEHEGFIYVSSKEGKGSKVYIFLPISDFLKDYV